MNRSLVFIPLLALAACAYPGDERTSDAGTHENNASTSISVEDGAFDGRNASFTVDGTPITLVNGISETPIERSAAKISTRYWGNLAKGDLNGDGRQDYAFLITQTTGGSGTFYYVVVALKKDAGYQTTPAFFIGDRIAPQSADIRSNVGELRVRYASHGPGEPMAAQPSEERMLLLKVTPEGTLEQV